MITLQINVRFLLFVFCCLIVTKTLAAEQKKQTTAQKTVVIESKVKGSQQQPKVLYIMPWQGIKNPIKVKGKSMEITLPQFAPINPSEFKQQVRDFNKQQKLNNKGKE